MTRTTYLPQPPAAQGYSVHHFAAHPRPRSRRTTPARWRRPVRCGARSRTWPATPPSSPAAAADVLAARHPARDGHPAVRLPRRAGWPAATVSASGWWPAAAGVLVGHTGSMPGFLAGLFVDRGPPHRRRGRWPTAPAGCAASRSPSTCCETLEECEPTRPGPWEPAADGPGRGRRRARGLALGEHRLRRGPGPGRRWWPGRCSTRPAEALRVRGPRGRARRHARLPPRRAAARWCAAPTAA